VEKYGWKKSHHGLMMVDHQDLEKSWLGRFFWKLLERVEGKEGVSFQGHLKDVLYRTLDSTTH
jgi:hypothetical protein